MQQCPHCNWQSWQPGESHRCPMLQLNPAKPTYKPTLYRDSTCSVCREENVPCFLVISSWRHGGHYLNGQQKVCIRCLTTGRWQDADKEPPQTHFYCGGIVEGSQLIKILNRELNKRGRRI